jgi:hypothetical protein
MSSLIWFNLLYNSTLTFWVGGLGEFTLQDGKRRNAFHSSVVADIEIVDFRMLSNGRKPTDRTQPYAPLSPCALRLKRLDSFTVAIAFFG